MTNSETARKVLKELSESADAEKLEGVEATILFDVSGEEGGQWTVKIHEGQVSVEEGQTESPTITVAAAAKDLKALIKGDMNPMAAFMQGKLKVKGDMSAAMQLQKLFG